MVKITIWKTEYEYEISEDSKSITITREDGAIAYEHDDFNHVGDHEYYATWGEWISENIDYIKFTEIQED